jgi:hypothetical protein
MPNIEIIVRETTTAEGASPSQRSMAESAGETTNTDDKKKGKTSDEQKALMAGIINVAKQQAMNGLSQYGNLTGNYAAVERVGNAIELITDIAAVVKGGPLGIAYVMSKHTINLINSSISQMNATREQDFRNQLLGKVATQGSRY